MSDAPGTIRHDLPPLRVLLAEDEEFSLKIERSVLVQLGVRTIYPAKDGEEALEALKREADAIDVVISDIYMPKLDGMGLLRLVRQVRRDMPFVLVTSEASGDTVRTALAAGVDGYIVKPFSPARVSKAVLSAIDRRRPGVLDAWRRSTNAAVLR